MDCFNDCTALNLTTCTFIEEEEMTREEVKRRKYFLLHFNLLLFQDFYDSEGCFEETVYLGEGDKYTLYLQVLTSTIKSQMTQNIP